MNIYCSNPSQEAFKSFTILLSTDQQQQQVQEKTLLEAASNIQRGNESEIISCWCSVVFVIVTVLDTQFPLERLSLYMEHLLLNPKVQYPEEDEDEEGRKARTVDNPEEKSLMKKPAVKQLTCLY